MTASELEKRRGHIQTEFERLASSDKPNWKLYRAWLERIYIANDDGLTEIVDEEAAFKLHGQT